MLMPTATQRWTADGVRSLPRGGRHREVVDGALLVNPPPSWDHQAAVLALARRLRAYLDLPAYFAEVPGAPHRK